MTDNRTGLSAADIAESFRDRCGDGSVEWVYTPMQTWVLLDAADMLEEFADTPKCEACEAMLDCDECLRADASQKERNRLDYENAKLRELVRDYERCTMHADCDKCEYDGKTSTHCPMSPCFPDSDELRELGVDA